jgi:SAM-dependent methyltransferase
MPLGVSESNEGVAVNQQSIEAYDLPQRVASYDTDMELMHPNRSKMVRVALQILPFVGTAPLWALDLGVGTGYFSKQFLARFPNSRVLAIDGARLMVDLAKARLGDAAGRVDFRIDDFRNLKRAAVDLPAFDVVFSSYALHHLNGADKQSVVGQAIDLLKPGGWFVNADLVVADSPEIEARIQEVRVSGIVERACGKDERFRDASTTRRYLDELEANEHDQPLAMSADLEIIRRAGLRSASALWLEHREAVCAGHK